jgi:cell division protein FtsW (lipid II flippase)
MAVLALDVNTKRFLRNINWLPAAAAVMISLLGIVCVRSAGMHAPDASGEFEKQIVYFVLGVGAMIGVAFLDYRNWQRWAPALYVINLLLLLFILRGGHIAM